MSSASPDRDEAGFALLEVIFSAALVLIIAFATLQAVDTTGAEAGHAQDRAVAATLLSSEQERLRSLNAGRSLANYRSSTPVTETTGTVAQTYTVASTVVPVRDTGGPVSCTTPSTTSSPDYLRANTEVSWSGGRAPLRSTQLLTPTTGSTPYDAGTLAVAVTDADGGPVANLAVTVAGRSLTTNELGCAVFSFVPQGQQPVTLTQTGWVEPDKTPSPGTATATVIARQTRTLPLRFDQAGGLAVNYRAVTPARTASAPVAALPPSPGFSIDHSDGDFPLSTYTGTTATGLFPFGTAYSIYAGRCAQNDPGTYSVVASSRDAVQVVGGQTATASVRMSTLLLKVTRTSGSTVTPIPNATVRLKASGGCSGTYSSAPTTTDNNGLIAIPVPYGTYTACASAAANGTGTPGRYTTSGESAVLQNDDPLGEALTGQSTLDLKATGSCAS